jgi:hypothetical protein
MDAVSPAEYEGGGLAYLLLTRGGRSLGVEGRVGFEDPIQGFMFVQTVRVFSLEVDNDIRDCVV